MESKIKRENYITIQGFMLTDLNLKGNDLIIYACIYGFSQAEKQAFTGSLSYLAEWTNSTKQSVIKCLKSLEDKGFISKKENYINGVKFCEYAATDLRGIKQSLPGVLNKVDGGIKQSLPNNINDNMFNKIDKVSKKEEKNYIQSYDELLNDFCVKEQYREAIYRFIKHLTVNGVKVINDRLERMVIALDLKYGNNDRLKINEIDNAITNGFKRLPCEERC